MGICWAGTPLRVRMLRKYLHKQRKEEQRGTGVQSMVWAACLGGQHVARSKTFL